MKTFIYLFIILSIFILTPNFTSAKEVYGIGILLKKDNNCPYPKVQNVLNNSPAAYTSIQPGDMIIKINGEDTSQMSLLNILTALKGHRGSCVNLLIQRNCQNTLYSLTRCAVKMPFYDGNLICHE